MMYSLYEYYSKSSLNLYVIRNHFLEHFYYQYHSRNKADKVLRSVINSSKISRILEESARYGVMPTHEEFLNVICSMMKFMFSSTDTQVLVVIDAAIVWDIEVNDKLHLASSEELKQNILRVFSKYQVYKEMTKEEFLSFTTSTVDAEPVEVEQKHLPKLNTWSLMAFAKEFGNMKVEEFANSETGDTFHSCVFTNGYTRTFVNFSSKLGELTQEEISDRKDELVVVQLPSGKYKLAKKGKGY